MLSNRCSIFCVNNAARNFLTKPNTTISKVNRRKKKTFGWTLSSYSQCISSFSYFLLLFHFIRRLFKSFSRHLILCDGLFFHRLRFYFLAYLPSTDWRQFNQRTEPLFFSLLSLSIWRSHRPFKPRAEHQLNESEYKVGNDDEFLALALTLTFVSFWVVAVTSPQTNFCCIFKRDRKKWHPHLTNAENSN